MAQNVASSGITPVWHSAQMGQRWTPPSAVLSLGRRVYRRLDGSAAGPLLNTWAVRRIRQGLQVTFEIADVFEVLDRLDRGGVRAWVAGGWAVDAIHGEQTRRHVDLDLVVEIAAAPTAERLLQEGGFGRIPGAATHVPAAALPDRIAMQDRRGRVVDLHTIEPNAWAERTGVRQPFAAGRIGGRDVPCLSAEAQMAGRRGYELTSDDEHDLTLLRAHARDSLVS